MRKEERGSHLQKEKREEKKKREGKKRERKKEAWIRLQEARNVKESTLSAGESCEWLSFLPLLLCVFICLN